jgi:hypothetical protein
MGKRRRPDLDPVAVIFRPVAEAGALIWVDLAVVPVMGVQFLLPFRRLISNK